MADEHEAGQEAERTRGRAKYWVLVDLGKAYPEFYIVPPWWMENDIHTAHSKYLADSGGHRVKNDASTHHAIPVARIAEWKDRWDVMGILPAG